MHLPPLILFLAITLNRRSDATNGALRAVRRAVAQCLQVAASFGVLARVVLLDTLAAEVLGPGYVAQGFFGRAEGLVPSTGVLGFIVLIFVS